MLSPKIDRVVRRAHNGEIGRTLGLGVRPPVFGHFRCRGFCLKVKQASLTSVSRSKCFWPPSPADTAKCRDFLFLRPWSRR